MRGRRSPDKGRSNSICRKYFWSIFYDPFHLRPSKIERSFRCAGDVLDRGLDALFEWGDLFKDLI